MIVSRLTHSKFWEAILEILMDRPDVGDEEPLASLLDVVQVTDWKSIKMFRKFICRDK
jgi:hypothetical protein